MDAGILTKWELSDAFDVARKTPKLPTASELKAMKWQPVGVEPPGMVVIDRYRRSPSIVRFFAEPPKEWAKAKAAKCLRADRDLFGPRSG